MKKLGFLILGLLCGILLPLSTQAIENGIYKVEGGHHTIIWNDDRRGNIEITIASGIISDWYYRGFNENYKNSVWIGDWYTPGTGTYYSGDKMYGNTNTINNARGGGGDSAENGFSPNPTNFDERQGPCGSGWHVPSRGELNSLLISRCNINSGCNAWYSDETKEGISGDLKKAYDWTINNKLIYITGPIGLDFASFLNLEEYYFLWTSSPKSIEYEAYSLPLYSNGRDPRKSAGTSYRNDGPWVLCFKNHVIEPTIYYIVNFLNKGEHIRSGEIESGGAIPVDIISGYNLTGLTKEGYAFSGWIISGSNEMFDVENDVVTTGMTLNAARNINQYTITFDTDGGSEIEPITADYGTGISAPASPTKNGYKFVGWDKEIPSTMPAENLTIKAVWEKIGYSGGGGRSSRTSNTQDSSTSSQNDNKSSSGTEVKDLKGDTKDSSDKSSEGQEILSPSDSPSSAGQVSFTKEQKDAYEFAKEKGITTMPTIQEAQMDGKLTRIAMAKMLSQYAMNVLGQKPANIVTPKFNDVTDKQNSDYDGGVTLAYQLGIMGQNMPNNKFRPNDEVTRAEFATALSRMAYGTSDGEYKGTGKYYIHHMEKLVKEGIITKDDPNMKELRGYVMIMLMRSSEK